MFGRSEFVRLILLDRHHERDGTLIMKEALKRLLDSLDTIFDEHEEVGDTNDFYFGYAKKP